MFPHDFLDANVEGLQLEQNKQSLEYGNVELFFAHELREPPALVLAIGCAAVIDQDLFKGLHVDHQIEAVVTVLGQDQVNVGRIYFLVIGLFEKGLYTSHHTLLQRRALGVAKLPRHEQIAVGRKRFVSLLELDQAGIVLLLAPIIEVAEKAPRVFGFAGIPSRRYGQAINKRETRNRDEALALALRIGLQNIGLGRGLRHRRIIGDAVVFVATPTKNTARSISARR